MLEFKNSTRVFRWCPGGRITFGLASVCAVGLCAIGLTDGAAIADRDSGSRVAARDTSQPIVREADLTEWAPDVVGGFASTHIIVRLAPGLTPHQTADGTWAIDTTEDAGDAHHAALDALQAIDVAGELLAQWNVVDVIPAIRIQPARPDLAAQFGLDRYYRVVVPAGTDTPTMAASLAAVASVFEVAEVDGIGSIAGDPVTPDDVFFQTEYGLRNIGQTVNGWVGTAGADIAAPEAWAITTGDDNLIIAVLDSGVSAHADLAGKLLEGHNVLNGSNDVTDLCNHGTHVAGTAAANTNNETGIAGVCWDAQILPVRVLSVCSGFESDLADGIVYATDAGAHVANMSLQFSAGTSLLHNAVLYADAAGMVMVAASGNFGQSQPAFPARWEEVIAVGATTNTDDHWPPSNKGVQLSVTAPGRDVFSLSTQSPGYRFSSGTSMASPHVAGTAILMLAVDPTLTKQEIEDFLELTADDLGDPGFDILFGHGRINAHAAILTVLDNMSVPGDLSGDGVVNGEDLALLLGAWGPCAACEDCPADLDDSCAVDGADLAILLGNWG